MNRLRAVRPSSTSRLFIPSYSYLTYCCVEPFAIVKIHGFDRSRFRHNASSALQDFLL